VTDLRFRKHQRIVSPLDFERIYERRCRASDSLLLIFAAPNPGGCTRIGLSVGRKHGNAVRRARLKRLLREAFRLCQAELPTGLDLVLIPKQGAELTLPALRQSLPRTVRQAARKLASEGRT
jgi:ribonuclease P protein component